MYVFIDESGIQKSSGYTVIVAVSIDPKDLSVVDQGVLDAEQNLRIQDFHWSKSGWKVRQGFMVAISKLNFTLNHVVIKNPIDEYEKAFETSLGVLLEDMPVTRLLIDGVKSKTYEKRLKKTLRDKGISTKVLKTVNDKSYPSIRIADAMAGIIRSYKDRPDHSDTMKTHRIIRKKII